MLEREVIVAWRSDQVRLMHFNFPFNTISNIEVPCEFVNIERVILYKLDGVGSRQYFWLFLSDLLSRRSRRSLQFMGFKLSFS